MLEKKHIFRLLNEGTFDVYPIMLLSVSAASDCPSMFQWLVMDDILILHQIQRKDFYGWTFFSYFVLTADFSFSIDLQIQFFITHNNMKIKILL